MIVGNTGGTSNAVVDAPPGMFWGVWRMLFFFFAEDGAHFVDGYCDGIEQTQGFFRANPINVELNELFDHLLYLFHRVFFQVNLLAVDQPASYLLSLT